MIVSKTKRGLIDKALKYWQKALRLQEWKIRIVYADSDTYSDAGNVRYIFDFKKAKITLADDTVEEMEETLIHELLHIHIGYTELFPDSDLRTAMLEFSVNSIAGALHKLKQKE